MKHHVHGPKFTLDIIVFSTREALITNHNATELTP